MKHPINLRINGSLLRGLIKDKTTIDSLASLIGTSRQTVHSWFSNERISPRHLSQVTEVLSLSTEELKALDRTRVTVEEKFIISNREYK